MKRHNVNTKIIDGIKIKNLKVIPDERGRLGEILRNDDISYIKFGQVYFTTTYPGVVKGWHCHEYQIDNFTCVKGLIKVALYDGRKDSDTYSFVNEFFIGEHNPKLITIPPQIYHGWMCVSDKEAYIINIPTEVFNYNNPDEIRIDPHKNKIPYIWERRDG